MPDVHDLEPLIGLAFQRGDAISHAIHQDLPSTAWNGAQAGLFKSLDHLAQRHSEDLRKVVELRRAESVNVDLRILPANMRKHVEVEVDAEFGVMTALQKHLHTAFGSQFIEFLVNLLE